MNPPIHIDGLFEAPASTQPAGASDLCNEAPAQLEIPVCAVCTGKVGADEPAYSI